MNKYNYCINAFKNGVPIQISGSIEAENIKDIIRKLVDENKIDDSGYEFLELRKG